MGLSEGLNLLALVIVPLVAVVVGQYLQTRSKKKDEQYKIFKELLRSRVFGINAESVEAYNMIHIVFSSHKEVRKCWDAYFASLCVENPSEDDLSDCEQKQLALLKEMAKLWATVMNYRKRHWPLSISQKAWSKTIWTTNVREKTMPIQWKLLAN